MDEPNLTPPGTEENTDPQQTDESNPAAVDDTNSDAVDTSAADGSGSDTGDAGEGGNDTVPESYADFDLPEGFELDAAALEEATPLFKELKLTQDQAQKVVNLYAGKIQAGQQAQAEAFSQLMEDWREASLNDKEFGGDKFEENIGIASAALDKFGTPELKKLMEDHGVGNHPEMIRFMVKVGRLTQEDNPGSGHASSGETDRVSLLYPNAKR